MTILIMFHFGTLDNFKHYYLHYIKLHLKSDFPDAVSYNRFVELESRVFGGFNYEKQRNLENNHPNRNQHSVGHCHYARPELLPVTGSSNDKGGPH